MITCTCGHSVEDFEDCVGCSVKSEILDYQHGYNHSAIATVMLCKPCYAAALARGIVLQTEAEENAWLALETLGELNGQRFTLR